MSKKKKNEQEAVSEVVNQTEHFIERFKKPLLYSVITILAITAIILGYNQFYRKPKTNEAMAQSFVAERYFRADSFALAFNGDGNALGFKQIIEEYGDKSGAAVYLYAGICELQLGQYKEAIEYLKKYKGKDPILQARALCNIGDAYAFLENNKEALSYYNKAAKLADNDYAAGYLLKAGIMYEEIGDIDNALKTYEEIKAKYPNTIEGYEIDKYIYRIKK